MTKLLESVLNQVLQAQAAEQIKAEPYERTSTAALTLFLFLLFGEQVSFSVLKYLSPDYEALLKPVITSLTISARWSWFLLIPLAWGSTNVFASLEHAATVIAKRERRSTVTIRLLSFALSSFWRFPCGVIPWWACSWSIYHHGFTTFCFMQFCLVASMCFWTAT